MTQDILHNLTSLVSKVVAALPSEKSASHTDVNSHAQTHTQAAQQTQIANNHQHKGTSVTLHTKQGQQVLLNVNDKHLTLQINHQTVKLAISAEQSQQLQQVLQQLSAKQQQTTSGAPTTHQLRILHTGNHISIVADGRLSNANNSESVNIRIPIDKRLQLAATILNQQPSVQISGQMQPTQNSNNPVTTLNLYLNAMDKVIQVPLKNMPPALIESLQNNTPSGLIHLNTQPGKSGLALSVNIDKQTFTTALNMQHVQAKHTLQTLVSQLSNMHISPKSLPESILRQIPAAILNQHNHTSIHNSVQGVKQGVDKLSGQLSASLDRLTVTGNMDKSSASIKVTAQQLHTLSSVLNQPLATKQIIQGSIPPTPSSDIDVTLKTQSVPALNNMNPPTTSAVEGRQSLIDFAKQQLLPFNEKLLSNNDNGLTTAQSNVRIIESMSQQPINTKSINALLQLVKSSAVATPSSDIPSANGPLITEKTTPNSQQILADVLELTQTDMLNTMRNQIANVQPTAQSPHSTLLSGLTTLVQISLANKLQSVLGASATKTAAQEHLQQLITPHLAAIANTVNQRANTRVSDNTDSTSELLQGISRLLKSHSLQQVVNQEWQIQHPDTQYFTLPNFLSGSKQPIQLLIKEESSSTTDSDIQQIGNKWHISLQFDIPEQGKLLTKAILQDKTIQINLYGSSKALLDNINQHKSALEQRLVNLGFDIRSQDAYQGVIHDSLLDTHTAITQSLLFGSIQPESRSTSTTNLA